MNLQFDFTALWTQVRRLTDEQQAFSLQVTHHLDPIDVALSETGVEVELNEIEDVGNLLSYKGRQILLYIPDHGSSVEAVLTGGEGKKFHVAHCKTLETMKKANRFERYVATTRLDGVFSITGFDFLTKNEISGEVRLMICKNCLTKLNYKQAALSSAVRTKVRNEFDITEFFETYSSCFPFIPKRDSPEKGSGAYATDWKEISDRVRAEANWMCNCCGIDLSSHKHLLHVHHVDGNKGNNSRANLRPLCAACHREQPFHSTLFIKREDMEIITKKRLDLGVLNSSWDSLIQYCDPALRGVLGLARSKGIEEPVVGHIIYDPSQDRAVMLDLAWPHHRDAISLSVRSTKTISGWRVQGLSEALNRFS